jgi:hypothetical protein
MSRTNIIWLAVAAIVILAAAAIAARQRRQPASASNLSFPLVITV